MSMKKFLIIAAIFLSSVLTGCSSNHYDEEAMQEFIAISENMKGIDSAGFDAKLLMYTDLEHENLQAKVTMNGELIITDQNPQMHMDIALSVSGISFDDVHAYLKDNVIYLHAFDTKEAFSFQDIKDLQELAMQGNNTVTVDTLKENFEEFRYQNKEDKVFYLKYSADKFMEMIKESNPEFDDSLSFERCDYIYTAVDQKWDRVTVMLDMKKDEEPISIEISFQLSDLNSIDAITFPDFSDYSIHDDLNDIMDQQEEKTESQGKQKPDSL